MGELWFSWKINPKLTRTQLLITESFDDPSERLAMVDFLLDLCVWISQTPDILCLGIPGAATAWRTYENFTTVAPYEGGEVLFREPGLRDEYPLDDWYYGKVMDLWVL